MTNKKTIVIIGASNNRAKFGNKAVRSYLKQGWTVYPVNPKQAQIEGLKAYQSILKVPKGPIDRVSMYAPPVIGLQLIKDIAHRQPKELFLNPGSESEEIIQLAKDYLLNPVQACSIVDIGEHPSDYN